jgi:hypothetical protein
MLSWAAARKANRAAFLLTHRQFLCWLFLESPYILGLIIRGSFGTNGE